MPPAGVQPRLWSVCLRMPLFCALLASIRVRQFLKTDSTCASPKIIAVARFGGWYHPGVTHVVINIGIYTHFDIFPKNYCWCLKQHLRHWLTNSEILISILTVKPLDSAGRIFVICISTTKIQLVRIEELVYFAVESADQPCRSLCVFGSAGCSESGLLFLGNAELLAKQRVLHDEQSRRRHCDVSAGALHAAASAP